MCRLCLAAGSGPALRHTHEVSAAKRGGRSLGTFPVLRSEVCQPLTLHVWLFKYGGVQQVCSSHSPPGRWVLVNVGVRNLKGSKLAAETVLSRFLTSSSAIQRRSPPQLRSSAISVRNSSATISAYLQNARRARPGVVACHARCQRHVRGTRPSPTSRRFSKGSYAYAN